ncbi:Tad domain-containing protein [Sphingomonas sp. M1-B02]|nr:Tad domain-containing protein [Sphingomonas sp. S6-11]
MTGHKVRSWAGARGFLTRFARDTRANTLALTALSLIPLAGMVGGGVDISRMYIVKTRLQHACDAGALAGRKMMGGGTWGFNSYAPRTQAEKFFDANYNSAAYGATNVTRSFSEAAGKVSGTASAVLPMTLMRIFGRTTETLAVACDAEMRLPNTDVMFVLDTTGSMRDVPSGDNKTKIAGLRIAVKCFYQIVARLDITDTDCDGDEPSGGTGNQVQIRFGFMPYATNVNVGKLLKPEWFVDSWNYQTREAQWNAGTSTDWREVSATLLSSAPFTQTGVPQNMCNNNTAEAYGFNPQTAYVYSNNNTRRTFEKTLTNITGWSATNSTCSATRTVTRKVEDLQNGTFARWRYNQLPVSVGVLKNGTSWNNSFVLPIEDGGTNKTINWAGCIEERKTERTTNYSPIPTTALDLDFESIPTTSDDTKWKPWLPGLIYTRRGNNNWNRSSIDTTDNYGNQSAGYCPSEAKRLQTWPTASDFDDYVDGLTTDGNTYHDIGLLWGARFASPTGLFAADNAFTSQGGEIERHIIFMTDGDTNTSERDYNAYGIPWFDRRQTPDNTAPNQALLDQQVDLRFAALCAKIKNSTFNGKAAYTLWVISFGSVTSDTEARLKTCATSGRYFSAKDSTELQKTFRSIADQISQLRLTR